MKLKVVKKYFSYNLILATFLVLFSVLLNQLLLRNVPFLQHFDNLFYDLESTLLSKPVDENIVIVAIDDISLAKLGRWPWSRDIHAQLLDKLTDVGVAGVAMDILFMEADLAHPENDLLLASAIRKNGKVVLPVLTIHENEKYAVVPPIAKIAEVAQLAHVNMYFDFQGIVREFDLLLELTSGEQIPSMALGLNRLLPSYIQQEKFGKQNRILVNFSGPPGQHQHISYADVLVNKQIQQSLRGKIILIGMTANGLGINLSTPVSRKQQLMSGIEFQANAFSTLQSGQIIHPLQWGGYTLISLLLILIPFSTFRFCHPGQALIVVLFFFIITLLVNILFLSKLNLWFSPIPILLSLFLSYLLWTWQRLNQLDHSLFLEYGKASATLDAIADAVITTDQYGLVEFMNPAAEKILACSLADVRQKKIYDIYSLAETPALMKQGDQFYKTGNKFFDTQVLHNLKGEKYTVKIVSNAIYNEEKEVIGVVYAINDLTEIFDTHREITFVATHDALTKLPNRILLQDRLQHAIALANREHLTFALLFIDLDGFKKINDAMGHAAGDLLLKEVALRLRNILRVSDTIARWGGDEFIILLQQLTLPSDTVDIAIKIIDSLGKPTILNQQDVFVTPSIGISLFPNDGEQADILLEKADKAMYNVKNNGRNNYCFYSQKLENEAKERLILESDLRKALELDEFELYYQPQINLDNNSLVGTEALIRWNHPEKGWILPDNFIPFAEEVGLIVQIGEWVIKTVCLQLKSWERQGFPLITVAINLSTHQFLQKNFIDMISKEIKKHNLSPDLIQVEITESMMINDIDQVIEMLDDLKIAGFSIAIDDFGTGYSSLEYLKRLPIDKLKIDRSFIQNILQNADDANIVQAVISLGHNLNMQIIAEGIENEQQATFLQKHQCDFGQGYLYSKPISALKMGEYLVVNKEL